MLRRIFCAFRNIPRKTRQHRRGREHRNLPIGGLLVASSLAISSMAQGPLAALSAQTSPAPAPAGTVSILTPAQMAPVPPHVSYVDGQLTIIAENCSLGDILAAVRKLTAVQIDLPPSASGERMAARLGPGRPYEVLVSLLNSTDFNYILQAANNDPSEVQSVLLTLRGKKSSPNGGAETSSARLRPSNRKAIDPSPVAEETAAPESPGPLADAADASQGSTSAATAGVQPARAQGEVKLASASDTSQPSLSPADQMKEGLQRLYEQRRQMIQEQNLQGPKPASTN